MKRILSVISIFLCLGFLLLGSAYMFLGPVDPAKKETHVVVVPEGDFSFSLARTLSKEGLIRNESAFWWYDFFFGPSGDVIPGGYRLSPSMNAKELLAVLHGKPQLIWLHIREGYRREQIGEVLAANLGWSESEKQQWVSYTKSKPQWEGMFFPGIYLFPRDESASVIADMMTKEFREKTVSLDKTRAAKNISWNTVLTIASLIQREAGGNDDMRLISGIIWNRINTNMRLDIDATLQYIKGNEDDGWWPRVLSEDKYLDSPYNTYKTRGLPPYPIANPGLPAIEAALTPEKTDCLFYLHDTHRQIHCSVTYEEHKDNIRKYLL